MAKNLYELIAQSAERFPLNNALHFKDKTLTYAELSRQVALLATRLQAKGVKRFDRVAIYLPKQFETVIAIFACAQIGAVFVPVNPHLKAVQVSHILQDCNVKLLITSQDRLSTLEDELHLCSDLNTVLLSEQVPSGVYGHIDIDTMVYVGEACVVEHPHSTDSDMAAILYTSGSTGKPKGVVLSHRNMLVGAQSVATYLNNTEHDVLLALLPLSFDYGLSQLTTAFLKGASVVLLDFFLVSDVVKTVEHFGVTGIAAVPPLWAQLAKANWSAQSVKTVRYFTNSGGALVQPLLVQLQAIFTQAEPYLMYGLTEAFRSTYLPPSELAKRPGSMGKAIPNAEIVVVREDGSLCAPNEPGELVHRGPLVSLGYWNSPEKTAERFKFDPVLPKGITLAPLAVWSGDTVKMDEDGFLYFIGRRDEMIKTSGYRVSPTEVEEAVYWLSPLLTDVAAIGVPHADLEYAILVLISHKEGLEVQSANWIAKLKRNLPNFMLPKEIIALPVLPKNANGKIDRKLLAEQYKHYFTEVSA